MPSNNKPHASELDRARIAKMIRLAGGPKALLTELHARGGKHSASKPLFYAWQRQGRLSRHGDLARWRREQIYDILYDRIGVLREEIAEIARFLDHEFDHI